MDSLLDIGAAMVPRPGFLSVTEKEHLMTPQYKKGSPVPVTLRERAQRAIDTHGAKAVHRATGLSESAFWRAVGGGPGHSGTALMLSAGLDRLEREGALTSEAARRIVVRESGDGGIGE